jgi:hypothetical protein
MQTISLILVPQRHWPHELPSQPGLRNIFIDLCEFIVLGTILEFYWTMPASPSHWKITLEGLGAIIIQKTQNRHGAEQIWIVLE